jgi:hypothetical protein
MSLMDFAAEVFASELGYSSDLALVTAWQRLKFAFGLRHATFKQNAIQLYKDLFEHWFLNNKKSLDGSLGSIKNTQYNF